MRLHRSLYALFLFALLAAARMPALAQADPATVERIVNEGKNYSQVVDHLHYLTKKIGPRLTSSPQLQKACEWTAKKFKEFGCKNVHLEQWGEFTVGFERGKGSYARMVSPEKMEFEFTTPSWTYGTNGKRKGPAVLAPATMEEFEKVKETLKGAWVVSKTGSSFRGRVTQPSEVDKAVSEAGIAGRVYGARGDEVVTSGSYRTKLEEISNEVRVTVRKKDLDAITSKLDAGTPVTLDFDIRQKLIPGPRPVYNVIAEIPGTEKPDEVVIVSGHLDSWDGPGAEGACDNGTGTMVALEAARILNKAKAKPKRTIRFVMWTGEEQGLLGSLAYVEKHKDELSKISAVFVDDGGTNYQGGLTCTAPMEPMLREALDPAMKAFPDMPIEIRVAPRVPQMAGSDNYSFSKNGVPAFFWRETGRANYGHVHHTQFDRFEEAIPEYLVQSATNSAAAAYIIACAPTMLPRDGAGPAPRTETVPTTTPPPAPTTGPGTKP